MTDREMLMIAYGALKADATGDKMLAVVTMLEEHLFPAKHGFELSETTEEI